MKKWHSLLVNKIQKSLSKLNIARNFSISYFRDLESQSYIRLAKRITPVVMYPKSWSEV
ncbi:MAG: hypothetical protein ACP5KW_10235 [Thermoproteota archaeon]